jgi:hypothetical protein
MRRLLPLLAVLLTCSLAMRWLNRSHAPTFSAHGWSRLTVNTSSGRRLLRLTEAGRVERVAHFFEHCHNWETSGFLAQAVCLDFLGPAGRWRFRVAVAGEALLVEYDGKVRRFSEAEGRELMACLKPLKVISGQIVDGEPPEHSLITSRNLSDLLGANRKSQTWVLDSNFVCQLEPALASAAAPSRPYQSSMQLRDDIDNKAHWLRNVLIQPIRRQGKPLGVQIHFKKENPLSRLGIHDNDILISLNGVPTAELASLPEIPAEGQGGSLHFVLVREGRVIHLDVRLP